MVNLPVDGFKVICLSLILHVGLHTLASAVLDLLVSFSHIVLAAIYTYTDKFRKRRIDIRPNVT
jgi:hypothetical protein